MTVTDGLLDPGLDNNANASSPSGADQHLSADRRRQDRRDERYELRSDLRAVANHRRLRRCGRVMIGSHVGVRIGGDGIAGYAGVERCGSVWVCPVCASKIMMRRSLEIAAAARAWLDRGGRLLLVTVTARHHAGNQLADVLDAVVYGWAQGVASGKGWADDRAALGWVGSIRSLEVLQNERNGWHPHLHVLLFVGPDVELRDVARFRRSVYRRWSSALRRKGFDALPDAQDVQLVTSEDTDPLAEYLAKQPGGLDVSGSLGFELASSQSKSGRSVGRTQWVLGASAAAGNARDVRLWREFEEATKGRRQLTWSRGLRELLGVGEEVADEVIAAEEVGTQEDTAAWITRDGWRVVLRDRLETLFLAVLEQDPTGGQLRRALEMCGVEYERRGRADGRQPD